MTEADSLTRYREKISKAEKLLQGVYDDISREIREIQPRIDFFERKSNLSSKERRELEELQYKFDALEDRQNSIDQAICALGE